MLGWWWGVESGGWRVEGGGWRVEGGEWRGGSGRWEVEISLVIHINSFSNLLTPEP